MHEYEPDMEPAEDEVSSSSVDIDAELSARRPERYNSDKGWMESVVDLVERSLLEPVENIVRHHARLKVWRREREAAATLNRQLRDIMKGRLTLWWDDPEKRREVLLPMVKLPLATTHWRVKFGAAEPQDLDQWASEMEKERDERRDIERDEEHAAVALAKLLRDNGIVRVDASL